MTAQTASPNHWVIVSSEENFGITRDMGFTFQGIKSRHRKKAELIHPGDTVIYYITGLQVLGGTAMVTSDYYEDPTPVWKCKTNRATEVYPFRFKIAPDVVLDAADYLPVSDLQQHISYLRKWPDAHWRLGFQGNIHLWSESDYQWTRNQMLAKTKDLIR